MEIYFLKLNDYEKLLKISKKHLEITQNRNFAYYNLGLVYQSIGNLKKQKKILKKSLKNYKSKIYLMLIN